MLRTRFVVAALVCGATLALAQTGAEAPAQAESTRPRAIRVAGAVMLGFVEHKTLPEYPAEAMTKGIQGDVIFKIVVDETGKIVLSEPVEGPPLLVGPSLDALRDYKFRPYLLNGSPIRVESQLGFHFALSGEGDSIKGQVECMTKIPDRPEFRTGTVTDKGVLILSPRKLSGGDPQLPPELAGKSGSVYLTITIGVDGKVQDVKVLGGDEAFISTVVSAVKQFVYEPQLIDGVAAVSTTEASYHFGSRN
jgi:TonB family protein